MCSILLFQYQNKTVNSMRLGIIWFEILNIKCIKMYDSMQILTYKQMTTIYSISNYLKFYSKKCFTISTTRKFASMLDHCSKKTFINFKFKIVMFILKTLLIIEKVPYHSKMIISLCVCVYWSPDRVVCRNHEVVVLDV